MYQPIISKEAVKRIVKAAGGRRVSASLFEKIGKKDSIFPDAFGIVHKIFRGFFDEYSSKCVALMKGEKVTTLLSRHVEQLGAILGTHDDKKVPGLPVVALAPILRRFKPKASHALGKPVRVNMDGFKLLVELVLSKTIAYLRSAAGLAGHSGLQTVDRRDVINAGAICQNFPRDFPQGLP